MRDLLSFVDAGALDHLQQALLHTLWQGALLAGLVFVLLRAIPARNANTRYALCVAGLAALVVSGLITFCALGYDNAAALSPVEGAGRAATVSEAPQIVGEETAAAAQSPFLAKTAARRAGRPSAPLEQWLLPAWLVGVCLMLVRALRLLSGAERIRRGCVPATDPELAACVAGLKSALNLTRRVTVLVGDHIVAPAVVGLLWPSLLLPASMASGLPPAQLRAVLAHELAHIRRYDYLVNFLQLLVEALLYFNPAVWWLGRQIRIEREACCDALAASVTGSRGSYAEALTNAVCRLRGASVPAAAMALGDSRDATGLLDRVRRLLVPGYRPKLRLRWYSIVLGLLTAIAALLGLYQSSAITVAVATWMLSDEERIEAIAEIAETHGVPSHRYRYTDGEKVHISGTIHTWDGMPLPTTTPNGNGCGGSSIAVKIRNGTGSIFTSIRRDGSTFEGKLTPGTIHITPEFEGYAPTRVGPFELEPGTVLDNIEIIIEEAIPARIQFTDQDGSPVEGVSVTGGYCYMENSWSHTLTPTSGADGFITFAQNPDPIPINVYIRARGFQRERRHELTVVGGGLYEWKLTPARPVEGIAVDAATGAPIEGAELLLMRSSSTVNDEDSVQPETLSDAEGRFVLDELNENDRYHYMLRARGYGRQMLHDVQNWQSPERIELSPRYIEGLIKGELAKLKTNKAGNPIIMAATKLNIDNHVNMLRYECEVEPAPDLGRFRVDDVLPGKYIIQAGDEFTALQVDTIVNDLLIDLDATPEIATREVVFTLVPPEGSPPPTGSLTVCALNVDKLGDRYMLAEPYEITNNTVRLEVQVPGRIQVEPTGLLGYYPDMSAHGSHGYVNIPEGETPFAVEVPLLPAGAIYGTLLDADGTPATKGNIRIAFAPETERPEGYHLEGLNNYSRSLDQGKFSFTPLPLGSTFIIQASRGNTFSFSKTIPVTKRRSLQEITLQFGDAVTLRGTVLSPGGDPVREAQVRLHLQAPGLSHTGAQVSTDQDGAFAIPEVSVQDAERLSLVVSAHKNCAPLRQGIRRLDHPVTLQLQEGRTATLLAIDSENGYPIPGVTLRLGGQEAYGTELPEVTSDQQGLCYFTNLEDMNYKVFASNRYANTISEGNAYGATIEPGKTEPQRVRIKLHEDSELKPLPPQ